MIKSHGFFRSPMVKIHKPMAGSPIAQPFTLLTTGQPAVLAKPARVSRYVFTLCPFTATTAPLQDGTSTNPVRGNS